MTLRHFVAFGLALLLGVGIVFAITATKATEPAAATTATAPAAAVDTSSVRDEIVRVVESSYIHGAFNEQNTDAMREGFHPVFKIHGVRDGELSTYPIADWVDNIDKTKAKDDYQAQTWEHRFPMIDITGGAAVVKVELLKVENGEKTHVYTDYLSLLEFADGWKITDKVYHRH